MIQAEKLKNFDPKKFKPGYASIKRNGVHAIYDPNLKKFYTRTPREIQGLDHLAEDLRHITFPVVGELCIPGEDFETASGKIRSSNSTPGAIFSIFNSIIPGIKFKDRYGILWSLKETNTINFKSAFVESMFYVDSLVTFDSFYNAAVAEDNEGVCWISQDHIYQPGKRTWDWMKRVPLKSIEAEIIDILPGTKGKKYEYSMGKMRCQFKDSSGKEKTVDVGIFKDRTDRWRQEVYNNKHSYIGQVITIEFKAYSKYGIPTQPRFKAFRWDL